MPVPYGVINTSNGPVNPDEPVVEPAVEEAVEVVEETTDVQADNQTS